MGTDQLPVLFQLSHGREFLVRGDGHTTITHYTYVTRLMLSCVCVHVQLKFEGVTVDRDGLSVVCPSKPHVFTPVFIGDSNPPRQVRVYLNINKFRGALFRTWSVTHFYLSFQQVYGLYNGCAVQFCYKVDLSVLSRLQKDNFNHPLLRCLNPEGKVLPGQTVTLEWIFSPMETKMYQVSKAMISPNTALRFTFFLFF